MKKTSGSAIATLLLTLFAAKTDVLASPRLVVDASEFKDVEFVRQLAVTRDDRLLIVSDFDTGIAVYDVATGAFRNHLPGHARGGDVSYQPTLDQLLTTGGGRVKLWDATRGRLIRSFSQNTRPDYTENVYLDPSGKFSFADSVKYDATGKVLKRYTAERMSFLHKSFRTFFFDNSYLTVSNKGAGKVFSISDDRPIGSFQVRLPGEPVSIHFDQRRAEVYFGFPDGYFSYDVRRRTQGWIRFSRKGVFSNLSRLTDTCVTGDGKLMISVSNQTDQLVVLERIEPGKDTFIDNAREVYRFDIPSHDIVCLANGSGVVVAVDMSGGRGGPAEDTVMLLDARTRTIKWKLQRHLLMPSEVAFDPTGIRLGVQMGEEVHNVDIFGPSNVPMVSGRSALPPAVAQYFLPSVHANYLWRFRSDVHPGALSPHFRFLWERRLRWMVIDLQGKVSPKEISEESFRRDFLHHSGPVKRGLVDTSGRYKLEVPAEDSWRGAVLSDAGTQVARVKHCSTDHYAAFSPDSMFLGCIGSDGEVTVLRLPGGKSLGPLPSTTYARTIAFSPDSSEVLVSRYPGGQLPSNVESRRDGDEIPRISLKTRRLLNPGLSAFDGRVEDIAVSPDGRQVAAAATDGAVRFWNRATGQLLLTLYINVNLEFLAFTPDGHFDGSPRFDRFAWNVDGAWAPATAHAEMFRRPQVMRSALFPAAEPAPGARADPGRGMELVPAPESPPPAPTVRRLALLVATNSYRHWPNLTNPISDVEALARDLAEDYGFAVDVLRNPTRGQLYDRLRQYSAYGWRPDDQLLVYVAGHGHFDGITREGYVVTTESPHDDACSSECLPQSLLRDVLGHMQVPHLLLMLDTCFGGTFDDRVATAGRGLTTAGLARNQRIQRMLRYKTRLYLSSGGADYVSDGVPGGHSPFARAILGTLRTGGADGVIGWADLVGAMAKLPNARFGEFYGNDPGSDFPFVRRH